ncbi:MAG: DHH family phosphoesterase [Candidatus Bathyarchaeota archaeon]|nr:MAG: DHH family phosphoesterase [Candidatus Bathyarchaeota archaeon]
MTFTDIINILDEAHASFVLLLCHHNADPDAICSAYAFQGLLSKFRPNVTTEIGTGQGISRLSKHILKHIPITVNLQPNVEKADVIVLLDTNTTQQLGQLAERVTKIKVPIIVIAHHATHPATEHIAKLCITNEEASSTCEIVYNFYKQFNTKPSLDEAKALFLGITFDTRHFVLAKASTFKTISELSDIGVNPQEELSSLSLPMDFSERFARMKASRRAKLIKIENWIIALSDVSAYQASAARALVDLGAHLAAVAGQKNEKIEISLRCTRDFNQVTGIHLGRDVAKPLGEYLQGMGGGHATAAGVNGTGYIENGLRRCLRLIREKLSNHK